MYPGYALPSTQVRPARRSAWLPLAGLAAAVILALAGLTIAHLLSQLDTMTSTLTHVNTELQTLRTMNRKLEMLDRMSVTLKAMDGKLSQTNRSLAVANQRLDSMDTQSRVAGAALGQMGRTLQSMRGDIKTMSHKIAGSFLFRSVR
ncbi:MAG: hypothetical protein M3Z37_11355 [Candidatus Eremiobacteraeota bacterium]|nr:hypothetical protein [Candidatus Eremiobacteraeota bacterium]